MSDLPSFAVVQNKEGYYEIFRILYASEIDYHWWATFKMLEDAEEFTKEGGAVWR